MNVFPRLAFARGLVAPSATRRFSILRSSPARASIRSLTMAVVTLVAFAPAAARAGQIAWETPQGIASDGDVLTTGSLVYAYNIGDAGPTGAVSATTVNGVTFAAFGVPRGGVQSVTVGHLTLTESPYDLYPYDSFGSTSAPYSGLSTAYKTLLDQAVSASAPGTITVTLGGLTNAQAYSVQWWTNDSSLTYGSLTTASGVSSVTLDPNTTDTVGGLGQYVIGSFTASGTTQSFTLTGSAGHDPNFDFPMISGLQVRTASAPVPEIGPAGLGSVLALVTGALGLLERRRKRAA